MILGNIEINSLYEVIDYAIEKNYKTVKRSFLDKKKVNNYFQDDKIKSLMLEHKVFDLMNGCNLSYLRKKIKDTEVKWEELSTLNIYDIDNVQDSIFFLE